MKHFREMGEIQKLHHHKGLYYNSKLIENTLLICNYVYVSIAKKVATVAKLQSTAKYCSIFAVKFERRQFSGTFLDKYLSQYSIFWT